MKVAVIGGGAAGMVTAYYLDPHHEVTVYERQPILGGNIRTLGRNVQIEAGTLPPGAHVDNGVIEFDAKNFTAFHALMKELDVPIEPVNLTTGYFGKDGAYVLSPLRVFLSTPSWSKRLWEVGKLLRCLPDFAGFLLRGLGKGDAFYRTRAVSEFMRDRVYYRWGKMLLMYAHSIPYPKIDAMPASLGIPTLRKFALFTHWTRIPGGVYTYIEHILERFHGTVRLGVEISRVTRDDEGVTIHFPDGKQEHFDKVVFATPPDQVLRLLADSTNDEVRRFSHWEANHATTVIHTDMSMYRPYQLEHYAAFDVFEKEDGDAGYNAYLDELVGVDPSTSRHYNLAFNLDDRIDPAQILHRQDHHTPLYTVDAMRYRHEVIAHNGEHNTFHAGAYLYDGLHEGAVRSALAVRRLLDPDQN